MADAIRDYEEYVEGWAHEAKTPLSLLTMLLDNRNDEISPSLQAKLDYVRSQLQEDVTQMLSQHKLKSSTVCIDCFRLQFVENDKLLLFKKWGIVLQNFTQAVIQIDILKSVILCTALQPGIVQQKEGYRYGTLPG